MKKLPFKPTALRRPPLPPPPTSDGGSNDDGLALFRRSKEMEPIMAADRERRLRRIQQKQEEELKRSSAKRSRPDDDALLDQPRRDERDTPDRSLIAHDHSTPVKACSGSGGETDGTGEFVTPPTSKRSRTGSAPSKTPPLGSGEAHLAMDDSPSTRRVPTRLRSTSTIDRPLETAATPPGAQAPVATASPLLRRGRSQSQRATPGGKTREAAAVPPSAQVIPLDSDDSDTDSDSDDGDDHVKAPESPSLRYSNGSRLVDAASTPSRPPAEHDEFSEYVRKAEYERDCAMVGSRGGASAGRETVDILVTSAVPGAGPCHMKYLFNKPLRRVRDAWLASQVKKGVAEVPAHVDDVILTWRRRKVYVYSTLLSLGIRPGDDGRLQVEGRARDGLDSARRRVHMEAWTPDLFREMELHEDRRRRREAGELDEQDADADADAAAADATPPPEEVRLRVILKVRGLEDVKLTVRPETTVETLIVGFRAQRPVASDKAISVVFDGDRLEEHVTMEVAGIDDLDLIEVHIKD